MKLVYSLIILFSSSLCLFGQQIDITLIERVGPNVVINYNLVDEIPDRKYSLHLYTSADNYIEPMVQVSGDIGIDLSVGNNKQVIWNAREELGADYSGSVAIEIKGQVYIPFIKLESVSEYGSLKRGIPYNLTWTGGRGDNILLFELYKGDQKIKVFEERPNIGNTNITIPEDVKPGKGYLFKISDKGNRDEVVFTGTFDVKRRIPLIYKVGAGAVITTVGYFLYQSFKPVPDIDDVPFDPNSN